MKHLSKHKIDLINGGFKCWCSPEYSEMIERTVSNFNKLKNGERFSVNDIVGSLFFTKALSQEAIELPEVLGKTNFQVCAEFCQLQQKICVKVE